MNRTFSLYLDAVRFIAAIGVFFSHFAIERWTGGTFPDGVPRLATIIGADFVMVFFVLSGFIIAYTTDVKDRNWRDFTFSRATRIYSVAIPAILLTFWLDSTGVSLNPEAYDGWWYLDSGLPELLVRGLAFSNELWWSVSRIGSNGPFWSLSYEIWYYVFFGFLLFSRGAVRLAACSGVVLLTGPAIILLSPVWFIGVGLYRFFKSDWFRNWRGPAANWLAVFMAVGPLIFYAAANKAGLREWLGQHDWIINEMLSPAGGLGRAYKFSWSWIVGVLVAVQFTGMAALIRNLSLKAPDIGGKLIRWFAGASFSIYLIHYPALQALDALLVGDTANPWRILLLATGSLAICFLFAAIFERRLGALRAQLRTLAAIVFSSRASVS